MNHIYHYMVKQIPLDLGDGIKKKIHPLFKHAYILLE